MTLQYSGGYPWNIFETEIRGMFFEYSGNIVLRLLDFAKGF